MLQWSNDVDSRYPPIDKHDTEYVEYETAEKDGFLFTARRQKGQDYVHLRVVTDQKEVYGSAFVSMARAKERAEVFLEQRALNATR